MGVLQGLKKCPKMYISGEITYTSIENYLEGHLCALEICLGIAIRKKIMGWFLRKINQNDISIGFANYVNYYYTDKSEEERIVILIELIEDFLPSVLYDIK